MAVAFGLILRGDAGAPPIVRGSPAPGFELPRLGMGGDESILSLSELGERVVMVNFWATWCEPCEREMPAMERLYALLPRSEFELVAIAIDETESDVEAFQAEYGLSFPILFDADQSTYRAYQTMGVPETLLIGRDGRIIERYVGPREWDEPAYVERIRQAVGASGDR